MGSSDSMEAVAAVGVTDDDIWWEVSWAFHALRRMKGTVGSNGREACGSILWSLTSSFFCLLTLECVRAIIGRRERQQE